MKLDIYNIEGKSTGRSVDLPDTVFGAEPNEHVLYLAVKAYLAHQRQGTSKAKERAEIAGSTRKIKKQKGTGTARAGSIKSPLFKGGGRVFGPRPRSYNVRLNRKVNRAARISALSKQATAGAIRIIEDFTFDKPQTKEFANVLNNLDVAKGKSILVVKEQDKNLYLSGRNIKNSGVVRASDLNTYQILNAKTILISENAIDTIKEKLA